tara:strand:+ start:421 stop:1308 length:888 start_codon:yes stop_codon:yes gene_type:complete
MIDRKEFAEELMLRENVRKAIRHIKKKKETKILNEEKKLRSVIQNLLEGQSAVASVAKHDSTGINALEDLLRNSNLLSVIETGFKSLTTNIKQRLSYRNHILNAIGLSLAPEESRKDAGEDTEITEDVEITEDALKTELVGVNIGDKPEDDPDFIDVTKDPTGDDEPVEVEVDEKEEFGIEGEDKTGRNKAFTDFGNVEKNILTTFDDLDDPADMAMFEEYLVKNIALYFDKYESELQVTVEPPDAAVDAVPDAPAAVPSEDADEADPETEVPEFELEEGMPINLESLVDKLLEQ